MALFVPLKCIIDSHPSKPNPLFSSSPQKLNTTHLILGVAGSGKWRNMVSFSPDARSLKVELYQAIAPLDRGTEATPEDQQRVDQIARKLEAKNSVKEPLKCDLLNGKWELLYTTSQSILQTQRPKFLRPIGKIYQAINVDTLRAQNIETWPFFNQATANLVPLNSRRVAVKFDFFKIASLITIKSPGSGRGQLEITYLDEDLRISRGNRGNLFILKMVDPSYRKEKQQKRKEGVAVAVAVAAGMCSSGLPYANLNPNSYVVGGRRGTEIMSMGSGGKKWFGVASGEVFLGLATRLMKSRKREERIDVVWEQRVEDVEAERNRFRRLVTTPGFSFSAAGLLFPYHLGVAHFLIQNAYIKETTPLAGSSAGAIVCAVIASGATMEEALLATKILAQDCRNRGTAFRLGAVLRDILENFLPDDVHIRSNGRVRVAVTQLLWRPRGLLVDQFDSKEDLINAVFTSSFIPGYLAPRPATMFRNRLCIDGGLTLFMPPTSAAQTVRVCAFPASRLGLQGIGISPDCNPENAYSPRQLFNWALEPAEDAILDRLFELGYLDAAVWAKENPVEVIVQDDSPPFGNSSA
ncbi:hypothetical protein VNO78_03524 [Psophocarpus tetragonolobus]|uniref:Patatin n=1 Tax=Psophocarpus tetragonolobus TaxID=3891 RepID=A0AAN9T0J7_PSOTE